jgi:hypothetical protein
VAVNRRIAKAGVVVGALCAASLAAAEAPHDGALAEFAPLIESASSAHSVKVLNVAANDASPAFERTDGKPADAILAQEGKAASLWNGRSFLTKGKIADGRVEESKFNLASDDSPAGWRREDAKLVHRESGLECPASFDLGDEGRPRALRLLGVAAYDQRGRDISCNYQIEGEASITVYASYYPDLSLEDHAAGAVAAMRQNFDIKSALPVISIEIETKDQEASGEKLPPALSGAFDVGAINGVPYKTAIWLAQTHGWHVKTRATYAQSDFTSEMTAAVLFSVNYLNVDMKNRTDPTVNGPEV